MLSFFSRHLTNKTYIYNTNLHDYIRKITADINHKYNNKNKIIVDLNTNNSSYNTVIPFISIICILFYNLRKSIIL